MNSSTSLSPFLFAGAALLFGSCAGSFEHTGAACVVRQPLSPGRTYYYAISEESRTLSDEKGEKMVRTNGVSLTLHCTATSSNEAPGPGGATPPNNSPARLRIVCDTLSLHQHSDDDELDMDAASALESGDPGVRMLGAFKGAELYGSMDDHGKLLKLSGLQEVYLRMRELGREPGEDHSGQAINWQRQLDPAFFASLFEKAWHIYPDTGTAKTAGVPHVTANTSATARVAVLAIGDSWTLPDTLDADSHIPLETTYTLVRSRNGVLHFTTRAQVDITGRRLDKTYRNGQITLKGRQVGFLDVDAATGMVLGGRSTLVAEGSLRMGETVIPLVIDSTYTVTALQS